MRNARDKAFPQGTSQSHSLSTPLNAYDLLDLTQVARESNARQPIWILVKRVRVQ